MKARDLNKYQGIFPAFYACYDDAGEVSPAVHGRSRNTSSRRV